MEANVGGADRILRIIFGLIILTLGVFVVKGGWSIVMIVIGVLMFLTGVVRCCPAYLPFKINTCAVKTKSK